MSPFRLGLARGLTTTVIFAAAACGSDANTLGSVDTMSSTTGGATTATGGATTATGGATTATGGATTATASGSSGAGTSGTNGASNAGATGVSGTSSSGTSGASGGTSAGNTGTGNTSAGPTSTGGGSGGASTTGSATSGTTTSGTGGRVDAGADAGTCPATVPITGAACTGSAVCSYGDTTCCGVHQSAFTCRCSGTIFLCTMTIDCNLLCSDGGSQDGSTLGDAGITCGTSSCPADSVCVRNQIQGGACIEPDDAGACPAGYTPAGQCCSRDPTYHCASRPASCGSSLTCGCAGTLCPPTYTCSTPSSNEVDCSLFAP